MSQDKRSKASPVVPMLIDKVLMSRTRPGYQALATHCGVSYSWIAKFAQGEIPDPKISVVHKLQSFFNENPSGFQSIHGDARGE